MRYILNSAVITAPGRYFYRLATVEEAREFLAATPAPTSTIGYPETAEALSALTGALVAVNRQIIRMESGDSALVFRLVLPPGQQRLPVEAKGAMGAAFVRDHCEIGILTREE